MKRYTVTSARTQAAVGIVRDRLYTLDEVAQALGQPKSKVIAVRLAAGVRPVFDKRPYKFRLKEFKEAFNAQKGEAMFVIEKDIPVPERVVFARELREALLKMEVGDSFVIDADKAGQFSAAVGRLPGCKTFRSRLEPEVAGQQRTRRVWRVS